MHTAHTRPAPSSDTYWTSHLLIHARLLAVRSLYFPGEFLESIGGCRASPPPFLNPPSPQLIPPSLDPPHFVIALAVACCPLALFLLIIPSNFATTTTQEPGAYRSPALPVSAVKGGATAHCSQVDAHHTRTRICVEHAGFRFPKMSTPYKYEGDTDAAVKAIEECKLCTSFFLTFVMFLPFKSPFRPHFLSNLPLCLSSFYGLPSLYIIIFLPPFPL